MDNFLDKFKSDYTEKSSLTLPNILSITNASEFRERIQKGDDFKNYIVHDIFATNTKYGRLVKGSVENKEKGTIYTVSVLFEDYEKGFDESPAKVYCSCPDFQFRFSWYLKPKKAFLPPFMGGGKLIPYTPQGKRPPVNPDHIPACCKHLVRFSSEILFENLVD